MNVIKISAPAGSGIVNILQNGLSSECVPFKYYNASTSDVDPTNRFAFSLAEGRADTFIVVDVQAMHHQTREALVARLKEFGAETVILVSTE